MVKKFEANVAVEELGTPSRHELEVLLRRFERARAAARWLHALTEPALAVWVISRAAGHEAKAVAQQIVYSASVTEENAHLARLTCLPLLSMAPQQQVADDT